MPRVLIASSLKVWLCETCDSVHVGLHDRHGELFAMGAVPLETAVVLGSEIETCCHELMRRNSVKSLQLRPAEGTA